MAIEVAKARRETPGCEGVLHFNNAGAALVPQIVLETVLSHLRREAEIGGYEAAEEAGARLDSVYHSLARLIGATKDEIAVVENATRAWDMAFYALPLAAGDRVLTGANEYGSNYIAFLQRVRRTGAIIDVVPNDEHGQLSVEALARMLDDRVKLVALTHVPTNGGLVNPAAAVGQLTRRAEIPFLLDACQSVGQMDLAVDEIGCDMLCATGRKYLRGPRGTGFLYVRRALIERLEPPFLDLHAATWTALDRYEIRADARRFENWETNVAGKLGLGAAVDYALGWGLAEIEARVTRLAEHLRNSLRNLTGVAVHDLGPRRCGIVSFSVAGADAETVCARLRASRINTSVSHQASTRIDMQARGLRALVRASVHYYNDDTEVDRFCEAIAGLREN
jgi:selenocysteine lyase/cysteine desulfurase